MSALNIAIVDDSNYSRKLISEILTETEGFDVIGEAANAPEAINFVKSNIVDILIVDIVMPEMSGLELTRALLSIRKNLHIILISSLSGENIVIDAIEAGASDFLPKPIVSDDLKSSLEKIKNSITLES